MNKLISRSEEATEEPTEEVCPLADDILKGADKIAEFIFGDRRERRKIYHLAENLSLPHFRLGSVLCARKSILIAWIAKQEARATEKLQEIT